MGKDSLLYNHALSHLPRGSQISIPPTSEQQSCYHRQLPPLVPTHSAADLDPEEELMFLAAVASVLRYCLCCLVLLSPSILKRCWLQDNIYLQSLVNVELPP